MIDELLEFPTDNEDTELSGPTADVFPPNSISKKLTRKRSTKPSSTSVSDSKVRQASFEVLDSAENMDTPGDVFPATGPASVLSLEQAVQHALQHNQFIIESPASDQSSSPILDQPNAIRSWLESQLIQSRPNSVAAAVAEFDADMSLGFQWGQNSILQATSNPLTSNLLLSDNMNFFGRLNKPLPGGGIVSLIHQINYANNSQLISTDPRFSSFLRGEVRQPLLSGRGRSVTRISGPRNYRARRSGSGVDLARISQVTAQIDFDMSVNEMLQQVQLLYWDLWLAQQTSELQRSAMENAELIWKKTSNRAKNGLDGGGIAEQAESEENYYRRKMTSESAVVDLQLAAARLGNFISMAESEMGALVAANEPTEVPIAFDLAYAIENAVENRKELQKQDLEIDAIASQLFAAKNLTRPQLDLVSGFQFNGIGDELLQTNNGAIQNLFDEDDVGWNVGFEFSMPVGLKQEKLQLRYLGLMLEKAKAARQLQVREIRQQVTRASTNVERWNQSLENATNRLNASQMRMNSVKTNHSLGRASLDDLIRANDSMLQSQLNIVQIRTELAKAQATMLHYQGLSPGASYMDETPSMEL